MAKSMVSRVNGLLGFTLLGRNKAKSGRIGVAVGPDGWAIALVAPSGHLDFCQFYGPGTNMVDLINAVVEEHGWIDMPCSVVLHPAYYHLFLAECPPVEGDELSPAVRWKIKELLDFPMAEAAIEHFLLPDDAYRGRQKMLYASALASLKSLIAPVVESGLNVDCIEISELAIHNIIARLPDEAGGMAVVQLYDGEGFINLVEDGALYFTRRLDIGLDKFVAGSDSREFFDALLLGIQRSLDYYESQLGKGIITRLFYSPGTDATAAIGEYLSAQLGLGVSPLKLIDLDVFAAEPNEHLEHSVSAIGAALGPYSSEEANRAAS